MIDLLGKLVGPVSNILDKVVEDKDQKAKLAHEIATMAEKNSQAFSMPRFESPLPRPFTASFVSTNSPAMSIAGTSSF